MYAGGLSAGNRPGGDPVQRTEKRVDTNSIDVDGVSATNTVRAGALNFSTLETTNCGAISTQQSLGGASSEVEDSS